MIIEVTVKIKQNKGTMFSTQKLTTNENKEK
jgi:hypothetical protein